MLLYFSLYFLHSCIFHTETTLHTSYQINAPISSRAGKFVVAEEVIFWKKKEEHAGIGSWRQIRFVYYALKLFYVCKRNRKSWLWNMMVYCWFSVVYSRGIFNHYIQKVCVSDVSWLIAYSCIDGKTWLTKILLTLVCAKMCFKLREKRSFSYARSLRLCIL